MGKEYIVERDGNYYVARTRMNFELLRLEEVYGTIAY
jgi:hypothetical protein